MCFFAHIFSKAIIELSKKKLLACCKCVEFNDICSLSPCLAPPTKWDCGLILICAIYDFPQLLEILAEIVKMFYGQKGSGVFYIQMLTSISIKNLPAQKKIHIIIYAIRIGTATQTGATAACD